MKIPRVPKGGLAITRFSRPTYSGACLAAHASKDDVNTSAAGRTAATIAADSADSSTAVQRIGGAPAASSASKKRPIPAEGSSARIIPSAPTSPPSSGRIARAISSAVAHGV